MRLLDFRPPAPVRVIVCPKCSKSGFVPLGQTVSPQIGAENVVSFVPYGSFGKCSYCAHAYCVGPDGVYETKPLVSGIAVEGPTPKGKEPSEMTPPRDSDMRFRRRAPR
jgi:hypothetical protein